MSSLYWNWMHFYLHISNIVYVAYTTIKLIWNKRYSYINKPIQSTYVYCTSKTHCWHVLTIMSSKPIVTWTVYLEFLIVPEVYLKCNHLRSCSSNIPTLFYTHSSACQVLVSFKCLIISICQILQCKIAKKVVFFPTGTQFSPLSLEFPAFPLLVKSQANIYIYIHYILWVS